MTADQRYRAGAKVFGTYADRVDAGVESRPRDFVRPVTSSELGGKFFQITSSGALLIGLPGIPRLTSPDVDVPHWAGFAIGGVPQSELKDSLRYRSEDAARPFTDYALAFGIDAGGDEAKAAWRRDHAQYSAEGEAFGKLFMPVGESIIRTEDGRWAPRLPFGDAEYKEGAAAFAQQIVTNPMSIAFQAPGTLIQYVGAPAGIGAKIAKGGSSIFRALPMVAPVRTGTAIIPKHGEKIEALGRKKAERDAAKAAAGNPAAEPHSKIEYTGEGFTTYLGLAYKPAGKTKWQPGLGYQRDPATGKKVWTKGKDVKLSIYPYDSTIVGDSISVPGRFAGGGGGFPGLSGPRRGGQAPIAQGSGVASDVIRAFEFDDRALAYQVATGRKTDSQAEYARSLREGIDVAGEYDPPTGRLDPIGGIKGMGVDQQGAVDGPVRRGAADLPGRHPPPARIDHGRRTDVPHRHIHRRSGGARRRRLRHRGRPLRPAARDNEGAPLARRPPPVRRRIRKAGYRQGRRLVRGAPPRSQSLLAAAGAVNGRARATSSSSSGPTARPTKRSRYLRASART